MSNKINLSNQIQEEFLAIKTLVNRFNKTKHYKTPIPTSTPREQSILDKLLTLLEPLNTEFITKAKHLDVERRVILATDTAVNKIASAVVAAAEIPPSGDREGLNLEFRF